MKKLKYIVLILMVFLMLPLCVFADDEDTTSKKEPRQTEQTKESEKFNIYFFYGEGCHYCAAAEEFFESIEDEYGKYYNLVMYETWNNKDNQKLAEETAEKYGDNLEGVPYIIIGKKTWNGYASSYNNDIIKAIEDEYNKSNEERTDYINAIVEDKNEKKSYTNDIIALVATIIISGCIIAGIIYTRKKTN